MVEPKLSILAVLVGLFFGEIFLISVVCLVGIARAKIILTFHSAINTFCVRSSRQIFTIQFLATIFIFSAS